MGWERWELRRNPFDARPLESQSELEHLFVGRGKELSKVERALSSPNCRLAIEADIGTGKTTFVNKVYSEMEKEGTKLLVPRPPVRVGFFTTGAEIKSQVAVALASALRIIRKFKLKRQHKKKIDEILGEAKRLRITGLQLGTSLIPPAITASIGVERVRRKELAFFGNSADALIRDVLELLPHLGLDGAIVAINSFDVLHEESFEPTLEDIRDHVLTQGISFLLLGGRGFYERTQTLKRWRGVFSARPIDLGPFSKEEMLEIINRRIRFYSDGEGVTPIAPDLMTYLCDLAGNNLRWLLSTSSDLAIDFLDSPAIEDQITIDVAKPILTAWGLKRMERLQEGPKKILTKMIKYDREVYSADKEFRKFAKCTQPWLHRVFSELEAGGHLVKRYEGKKVLYSIGPDYKILTEQRRSRR